MSSGSQPTPGGARSKLPSSPAAREYSSWAERFSAALQEIFGPARDTVPETVTVAEELAEHVLAEDVSAATVEEIQQHAENYPGTRIVRLTRRTYPSGPWRRTCSDILGRRQSTPHAPRDGLGYRCPAALTE